MLHILIQRASTTPVSKDGLRTIRAAVVSGLGNVRKLLEAIEHGEVHYDFVEVMACPGGCVGGGGQPIHDGEELAHTRGANLYFLDKNAKIRFSHENQDVMKLYSDFLEKPLSHKSHTLLPVAHTCSLLRFFDTEDKSFSRLGNA